jgi:OTU domain-containing protein 6
LDLQRKERKTIQSRIQSLKKSVTKGDKKKKKDVDAEIERIEREFEDKCKIELEKVRRCQVNEEVKVAINETDEASTLETNVKSKLTKAQKRREKKDLENRIQDEEIAKGEIASQHSKANVELKTIKEKLKLRKLCVKEVVSDGNCMYYAISDQLVDKLKIQKTWQELRSITSDYMLKNANDFMPYFISFDDNNDLNEDKFKDYCNQIKIKPIWGGHLELKALSDYFKVKIIVVQADGNDIIIGDDYNDSLMLTYHKHMFNAGEHYNSTEFLVDTNEF